MLIFYLIFSCHFCKTISTRKFTQALLVCCQSCMLPCLLFLTCFLDAGIKLAYAYFWTKLFFSFFQGIPLAPLWDFSKGQFVGVLTALDFILILREVCLHLKWWFFFPTGKFSKMQISHCCYFEFLSNSDVLIYEPASLLYFHFL